MTNIKPKYEIGQEVYVIHMNEVKHKLIWGIESSFWDKNVLNYKLIDEDWFFTTKLWWGSEPYSRKEEDIFATKEDIIKDLP